MPDGEQGRRERRIRTVIVEDEAPARGRLLRFLKAHADIEVAGEAAASGLRPGAAQHREFEHFDGQGDPDEACGDPSCPARAFDQSSPPTWFESRGE